MGCVCSCVRRRREKKELQRRARENQRRWNDGVCSATSSIQIVYQSLDERDRAMLVVETQVAAYTRDATVFIDEYKKANLSGAARL